jgi:hypothetical protein
MNGINLVIGQNSQGIIRKPIGCENAKCPEKLPRFRADKIEAQ